MKIYTRIVLDMTQDDLPVLESDSFEYDGDLALCGRDSDGSGGSANGGNGEGNGNESGGRGDSGGSEGGMGGYGGYSGLGIGNPSSYGGQKSGGFNSDGVQGQNVGNRTASRGGMAKENASAGLGEAIGRNTGSSFGKWAGALLGFLSPIPGATWGGGYVGSKVGGEIGAALGAVNDREALGHSSSSSSGASSGGSGSGSGNGNGSEGGGEGGGGKILNFSNGYNATYDIPEAVYNNLVSISKTDKATADFLGTLNQARSKVQVGSDLIGTHNKNIDKMNNYAEKVYGSDRFVPINHATSLQLNGSPKQYEIPTSTATRALDEIEEAKRLGARINVN